MKILSIDPGYERLGIAILEKNKIEKEKLLYSDCFKTSAKDSFHTRLGQIGKEIRKLIEEYEPEALAIENLFFESNQKTAMHVAETRGVLIYEAVSHGLTIQEFTPLQIKAAVTGSGRADKKQVISMIGRLIELNKEIKHDDEYDAIACGLTYFASNRML